MSSVQLEPRIFIKAEHEGGLISLNAVAWHNISGKQASQIRRHFHMMESGELDITPEQCVGLYPIDHAALERAKKEKSAAMKIRRNEIVKTMLSRALVY